ncbi:hypothetical protein FOIG_16832 [Fusarium odoratissimum NRRL 54006]|uniref:Uncharacterized protein n=1 Tax=Fusarium odoratissimum (strain NRRL 54006) TaxID=1089451 RepID=X0J0W5_FUSO5|nr:uncharacterized protein FOIG_16832 [Fusarium odoratissimum NRRL 54006]EXL89885.1 hypothetical protein FOIG_16832 [Fusarium odoratissimum NRRL 54006]
MLRCSRMRKYDEQLLLVQKYLRGWIKSSFSDCVRTLALAFVKSGSTNLKASINLQKTSRRQIMAPS